MNLIRHDSFWNAIMSLPTTKKMLDLALKTCSDCNRTILEAALDDYVGKSYSDCVKYGFYKGIVRFWIEILRLGLSLRKEKIQNLFVDPYARRAIVTITRTFKYFGIRKPLSIYAPFLVVWDFTHRCNLTCKHCYSDAGSSFSNEMTTKKALEVVDQLADFGVVALAFSGGEPLARKDFFEVAEYAIERGLYVSVATNGTLLTKEVAKKLKKARINYVEISIDGATASSHDEFRGVPGAFYGAISGLKNCVEENLVTCIAVTATKTNFEEIPEILKLAEGMGVERFTYFNFIPTGRGRDLYSQDLEPEEREKLLVFLLNRILKGCEVSILTTAPQLARVALQNQEEQEEIAMSLGHMQTARIGKRAVALADFIGGCGAGRLYCSLSPEGDVHPCVFLPIKVGTLKSQEFEDIWLNSEVFKKLRNRANLKGSCGKCDFKYVCGGCRARAFAYHKDVLASDVGCMYTKTYER